MLHQRRASQARKGRVLLGGDALHSDNPIGGLGLTTGVLNAIAYENIVMRDLKRGEPGPLTMA